MKKILLAPIFVLAVLVAVAGGHKKQADCKYCKKPCPPACAQACSNHK